MRANTATSRRWSAVATRSSVAVTLWGLALMTSDIDAQCRTYLDGSTLPERLTRCRLHPGALVAREHRAQRRDNFLRRPGARCRCTHMGTRGAIASDGSHRASVAAAS